MSSNRTAIAAEIQAALTQHGVLTSAELTDCCPSAEDREIISKVIYQLRQSGVIEPAGVVPGAPGRGSKQVNQWRLTAAEPIPTTKEEEPMPKSPVTSRFEPAAEIPATEPQLGGTYEFNHVAPTRLEAPGGVDGPSAIGPTEEALSNLVDQADEAVLALADSLLSDHPVWSRLRALQSDTFQALCDWRLRSYLSTQDKEPNQ